MKRLQNKLALITSDSRGIGYSIEREFMAQGANVIITGRNKSNHDEALKSPGQNAQVLFSMQNF